MGCPAVDDINPALRTMRNIPYFPYFGVIKGLISSAVGVVLLSVCFVCLRSRAAGPHPKLTFMGIYGQYLPKP